VESVKKGEFHIYAISNVREGIEILTGVPAGRKLKTGGFTKNSVFDLVNKKIKALNAIK
jgi:predicted ATP-dependent protease